MDPRALRPQPRLRVSARRPADEGSGERRRWGRGGVGPWASSAGRRSAAATAAAPGDEDQEEEEEEEEALLSSPQTQERPGRRARNWGDAATAGSPG